MLHHTVPSLVYTSPHLGILIPVVGFCRLRHRAYSPIRLSFPALDFSPVLLHLYDVILRPDILPGFTGGNAYVKPCLRRPLILLALGIGSIYPEPRTVDFWALSYGVTQSAVCSCLGLSLVEIRSSCVLSPGESWDSLWARVIRL